VFPQLPDGVAPGPQLIEERVGLGDVGRGRQREIVGALDLIAEELDVFATGGLVEKTDLHRVESCPDIDRDLVVAAFVLGFREVVGIFDPVPDGYRHPLRRIGDIETHRRDPVVLIAAVTEGEVEGLRLTGDRTGGVRFVDEFIHVFLTRAQRRGAL
jgi:hypothetical protein